jgi:hypothetical protein
MSRKSQEGELKVIESQFKVNSTHKKKCVTLKKNYIKKNTFVDASRLIDEVKGH